MPTWPTVKPVTTTTDSDSDTISGARDDINKAITNVNTITDFFNLGTPGASDDDKVLTYDHTTGYIVLETASGGASIGNLVVTGTPPNQTTLTTDATNKDITIETTGTGELLLRSSQKVEVNTAFEATGGVHTTNAVRLHAIGTSSTGNLVLSGHTISVDSQGPGGGDQIIINPGSGGTVTIEDELNINNAYTLPSVDGSANYYLRTDGAGTVTWVAGTGGGLTYTDFSVGAEGTASGDGAISYNNTNGVFTYTPATIEGLGGIVADTTPQLGADLQVNDSNITNSDGSNRGDAFVIGSTNTVETSTSTIVSGIDTDLDIMSAGTTSTAGERIAGPVKLVKISDLNTWNDRVHSNCTATKIELTDSFGEQSTGAERGRARIRNGYHDITLNTKGYQFGNFNFERFGDGLSAGVFSAKAFTDVDNGTAHTSTVKAVTLVPQGDGSAATLTGSNKFTINKLIGAEIEPFVDSATDVNTFYGVRVKVIDSGAQATVTGSITNKYSFFSDNAAYVNYNAGGFTPGAFASTALPTNLPAGTQIAVSDAASTTNGTNNYQPAYTPDGTNWYYVSNDLSV